MSESTQSSFGDEAYLSDVEEYLSLLCLGSPRVRVSDSIDPFLSRYGVPEHDASGSTGDLVRIRHRGFIPAAYVVRLFILMTKALVDVKNPRAWGAMQMHGFGGEAVTVLRTAEVKCEAGLGGDRARSVDEDIEMAGAQEIADGPIEKDNHTADMVALRITEAKATHGSGFVCWEYVPSLS
jgi:hypothetical protein